MLAARRSVGVCCPPGDSWNNGIGRGRVGAAGVRKCLLKPTSGLLRPAPHTGSPHAAYSPEALAQSAHVPKISTVCATFT